MSYERWEAADYAELQMDEREGSSCARCLVGAAFQVTHSAKECLSDLKVLGELYRDALPPRRPGPVHRLSWAVIAFFLPQPRRVRALASALIPAETAENDVVTDAVHGSVERLQRGAGVRQMGRLFHRVDLA